MKKRILAAILGAAMTFSTAPILLPAANISVSAANSEKLPAPEEIDVIERTDDSATLLWDPVEGADDYVIFRYNFKTRRYEEPENLKEEDFPAEFYGTRYPSYKIEGMKKGEAYWFKIAARVKGADGKYAVQTRSLAVKVKLADAPEISIPPIGMTKTEFFQANDPNAFTMNFLPVVLTDPKCIYGGNVLYRGEPAEVSVNFDPEGRVRGFFLSRKDIKRSVIDQELCSLSDQYGEPYFSDDTRIRWFLQEDKDRGMDIAYTYMQKNGSFSDMINAVYAYKRADEIGQSLKNGDPFSISAFD